MSRVIPALASGPVDVTGSNLTWVIVVAVVALCALGVAAVLVREVLAASKGTAKMQEISQAVQARPRTCGASSARWPCSSC